MIAQAQCGDLLVTLAYIYKTDTIALRGMQHEDGGMVIVFDRKFTDEVEALRAFAQAITDEYAGA